MIIKKFGVDFHSPDGALTLPQESVTDAGATSGQHTRTHDDGWTISGEIYEDYFVWVNNFEASHPTFGRVWGNFEKEVFADSEEGFADFYAKHPPKAWDYHDI